MEEEDNIHKIIEALLQSDKFRTAMNHIIELKVTATIAQMGVTAHQLAHEKLDDAIAEAFVEEQGGNC